jgi:hypothetical protein
MLRHLGRIYTRLGGATHVARDVQSPPRPCQSPFDSFSSIIQCLSYILLELYQEYHCAFSCLIIMCQFPSNRQSKAQLQLHSSLVLRTVQFVLDLIA